MSNPTSYINTYHLIRICISIQYFPDKIVCPDDCTDEDHGKCEVATGTCTCKAGFTGENCAGTTCLTKTWV